jgi:hypothetical protein
MAKSGERDALTVDATKFSRYEVDFARERTNDILARCADHDDETPVDLSLQKYGRLIIA